MIMANNQLPETARVFIIQKNWPPRLGEASILPSILIFNWLSSFVGMNPWVYSFPFPDASQHPCPFDAFYYPSPDGR